MTEHSNRNPIAASAKALDQIVDHEADDKAKAQLTFKAETSWQIARRGRGRHFELSSGAASRSVT